MNIDKPELEPGWAPLRTVELFLRLKGIHWVKGERHNRTDGEYHWICKGPDNKIFDFHGNCWDAESFKPLLDWVDSL